MKEKYETILTEFYNTADGVYKIDDFYINKKEGTIGVSIFNEFNIQIEESFSNISIYTETINYEGEISVITLSTSLISHRQEFAMFSLQFLENGPENNRRIEISKDPLEWWNKMRELIGNRFYQSKPYDIIGELYVYKKLLSLNKSPIWAGIHKSTIDIETEQTDYEVKTSTVRYENQITISSQFQLADNNKNKKLIYVIVEESLTGISINDILKDINKLDEEKYIELNQILIKKNIREKMSIRNIKYKVLDLRIYEVNEEFPQITSKSFKEDKIHPNIKKITYTIDLTGINYSKEDW